MAKGINKVILVGNLGQDPEVRYTQSGSAITNISIATTDSWTDKQSGQRQDRTEWHRVVFFNRLAEIAGEYLRKGSQVYVEGALRTRKWQDQQGQDRYTTEIVASEMQMLGGRGENMGGGAQSDYGGQASGYSGQPSYNESAQPSYNAPSQAPRPAGYQQPAGQPASQPNYGGEASAPRPAAKPESAPTSMDSFDDDIPF